MSEKISENRIIYHGGARKFVGKRVIINGVPQRVMPAFYKRIYINETGGTTVEFSLKPFKHETAKKSYPR